MRVRVLKISDLTFDDTLYPRMKVGWLTAYQYAQAMKAGSVFPPILVGLFEGKHYVVDGWHRIEAMKLLKEEHVQAMVKRFKRFEDMFAEAVKMNSAHGRPLSVQEKVRIINRLEEFEFSKEEISQIIKVPADKIEPLKARIVFKPDGTPIYLKSVVAKAVESSGGSAEDVDQNSFSVRNVPALLLQLLELLETDIYPIEDKSVKELSVKLYGLLGEKLQLTS